MGNYVLKDVDFGEVEIWKLASLGYILAKIKDKYPKFSFNHLFLFLYLAHFKYLDANSYIDFQVFTHIKKSYIESLLLAELNRMGLIDKIDLNLRDSSFGDMLPKHVYKLTDVGSKLIKKIHRHLNGTDDFHSFKA